MLDLHILMTCKQEMTLTVEMQWCENIFPEVEHWLRADNDRQKAVARYCAKWRRNKYWSVMDMIVGEFFGDGYRKMIFAYYKAQGAIPLRKIIDDETRNKMAVLMLLGCIKVYNAYCEKRRVTEWGWNDVRDEVHAEFVAA